MGKSSRKQKPADQKGQGGKKKGPGRRWTLGHVVAAFLFGAIFGFVIGFQPTSESGDTTDAYGRASDDPHYQHNHP